MSKISRKIMIFFKDTSFAFKMFDEIWETLPDQCVLKDSSTNFGVSSKFKVIKMSSGDEVKIASYKLSTRWQYDMVIFQEGIPKDWQVDRLKGLRTDYRDAFIIENGKSFDERIRYSDYWDSHNGDVSRNKYTDMTKEELEIAMLNRDEIIEKQKNKINKYEMLDEFVSDKLSTLKDKYEEHKRKIKVIKN